MEDRTRGDILVNPIMYYRKPALGQGGGDDITPIQVVFPSGGFALGLAVKDMEAGRASDRSEENDGVIVSAPMDSSLDRRQVREYKTAFLALAVINVVFSFLLFLYADVADTSKVEPGTGYLPSEFTEISSERRPIEKVNLAFFILLLLEGALSAIWEQPTGISVFVLGILLNFFLGTAALPFFVYSLRYVVDCCMIYVALVLRSRLTVTFLVLNPHRF